MIILLKNYSTRFLSKTSYLYGQLGFLELAVGRVFWSFSIKISQNPDELMIKFKDAI